MKRALWLALALAAFAIPAKSIAMVTIYQILQWDHDTGVRTVQSDCLPQTECDTGTMTLGLTAQFRNSNYTCFATQPPGSVPIIPGIVFEFFPQSTSSTEVKFFNMTGETIYAGTQVGFSYFCQGMAMNATPTPSPTPTPTPMPTPTPTPSATPSPTPTP